MKITTKTTNSIEVSIREIYDAAIDNMRDIVWDMRIDDDNAAVNTLSVFNEFIADLLKHDIARIKMHFSDGLTMQVLPKEVVDVLNGMEWNGKCYRGSRLSLIITDKEWSGEILQKDLNW